MVATGEDELICDFAQYYHCYNWRGLPLKTAATLAVGLPEESRTMMRMSGQKQTVDRVLLAAAVDRLSMILWLQSADARHGRNKPESVLDKLTGKSKTAHVTAFSSGDEFWKAASEIMGA